MTERGLPSPDGAPACPFVAFGDDRDARSTSPDHRHRCFAESPPAPRALAHQEAYCLSSAFPVCPVFQEWARREAARADGSARTAPAPPPEPSAGFAAPAAPAGSADPSVWGAAAAAAASAGGGARPRDDLGDSMGPAPEWAPPEIAPRRNPPRDWAAPPPWATGPGAGSSARATDQPTPDFLADRSVEGRGLAGSAADQLAGGSPPPSSTPPGASPAWSASAGATLSVAPDDELAGLVGGRTGGAPSRSTPEIPPPVAPPPSAPPPRSVPVPPPSRRPPVSSTRPKELVQGPSWERGRRYEAYPTIRTRTGLPGLPRVAVMAGLIVVVALALFFLPAFLGIGGGGGSASPSPSASSAISTAEPSPTAPPAPTQQVYVVKAGDTMSKIARNFGLTADQLCTANKATVKDCNKIAIGAELIIPTPPPDEFTDTPAPSSS